MKKLLLSTLFIGLLFSFQPLKASHLLGGEITWTCNNAGKFVFTLVVYRDCNGITLSTGSQTISSNSPAGNFLASHIGTYDVSPACHDANQSITCAKAESAAPGVYVTGAVSKYVYRSAPITINGTPPAGGWMFTWNSNARPSGDQNHTGAGSASYFLRAKMYPYVDPATGTAKNTSPCYDSSPIFSENGSPVLCTGYKFTYNHLAADQDLDSLYFAWADPWVANNSPLSWKPGFSSTAPYPDGGEHPSNGPIVLDGTSGELTMEVNNFGSGSAQQGSYASCMKIEAWRDCQLIAEVFRDVSISFIANCATNNQPVAVIDTATYPTIRRNGNIYRTKIYPMDTLEFDLNAQDFEFLPDGTPQTITFEAAGLQASIPLTSGTGCLGNGTCAKFTPVAPQTSFSQSLQNNIHFFWSPDCGHLGTKGRGCGSVTSTYYFTLKMKDNACPAPSVSITTLIVDVVPGDQKPPQIAGVSVDPVTSDINVCWNEAEQDSALKFNYYVLLGSPTLGGPYDTLVKEYDVATLSANIPASGNYRHFYMVKSTGECDFISDPSDTLSVIQMNLVPQPQTSSEYAHLSWTPLHDPLPSSSSGFYEIWIEAPYGSNNWNMVGQTTDLTYIDTVQVCQEQVRYQIRVTDTVWGCQSSSGSYQVLSTLNDSATFSDKTNSDVLAFDYVTVNTNGNTELSWNMNNISKDVVEFLLQFNDPISGWGTVQNIPVAGLTMPYEWTNSMADTRSEMFKIICLDSCGNQSDEQKVIAHNTIYLRSRIDKCEGTARLSWNPYGGKKKEVIGGYYLLATLDNGSGPGAPQLLYSGGPSDTVFVQTNFEPGTEYCYSVHAYDTTGTIFSTSNQICEEPDVAKPSRIIYMAQVTNNPDRGSIDLKAFVDGEADVVSFDIERSTEEFGIYSKIGNISMPNQPPYTISFSDYAINNTQEYYYRLVANNICGGKDTTSNIGRNIVLSVEPNANLTNSLSWSPYERWGGEVAYYEIYRSLNDENKFELAGSTLHGGDTTYMDDIKDFGNQSGKFCYYIKAVEGPHPLGLVNENGDPFSSRSNEVCMNQGARVYVPTAFRPGSDINANRTFGPSMRFEEVEEYNFYILNRWGKVVFQTNDPAIQWDGKDGDNIAPTGVYVYYLKYSTRDDIPREERGTFTLVN